MRFPIAAPRPFAALAVATIALALVTGCAPKAAAPRSTALAAADLKLMTQAQKAKLIAVSFPPQVPVPDCDVLRGEAQGANAWDYQLLLQGDAAAVAQWYRQAYQRAEWTITSDANNTIAFEKNSAQSKVVLEAGRPKSGSAGAQPTTRATVTLGIGTPVLQTQ